MLLSLANDDLVHCEIRILSASFQSMPLSAKHRLDLALRFYVGSRRYKRELATWIWTESLEFFIRT